MRRQRRGPEPRSAGFTLIELTVALAIVSLVALAALRLQHQSFRAMERARDLTQAVLLAQEKLTEASVTTNGPRQGRLRTPGGGVLLWEISIRPTEYQGVDAIRVRVRQEGGDAPIMEAVHFAARKKIKR